MPRYRLDLEYDGGPYKGFQAQADLPTIQGSIERAVLAFSGEALRLQAAGRTDTGVHALHQVVHIDLTRDWPPEVVRNALNAHLVPAPVAIIAASLAPPDFHARFSAKSRRYLYRILNRPAPPGLEKGRVWHVKKPLDAAAMAEAARALIGHHDFTTFRDVDCQAKTPMKTLDVVEVARDGDEVRLNFAARSFLATCQCSSMKRRLRPGGSEGAGRWTADDLAAALAARERKARLRGPVAPAEELYLAGVEY